MDKKQIGFIAILAIVVLGIYSNVYDMAFVYDDEFYIQKNQFLRSWDSAGKIFLSNSTAGAGFQDSFYRPMQFFFYLITQQIIGTESWGFHGLNVLLHVCNAILVFFFFQQLGSSRITAFCMSLLWAVHPVHVEVIAYISGTADPLHALFCLSALILLLKKIPYYLPITCLLFLCAILSKEVAVVFPGLAMTALFVARKERWDWRTYKPVAIYLLMALIYVSMRATVLNFNGDFSFYKTENIYTGQPWVRFLTFLATLPNYLLLLIKPVGFHIDREFAVRTTLWQRDVILGFFMLLAGTSSVLLAIPYRQKRFVILAGATMWFAAAHSLHSGVLLPMNSLFLEHWLYLPSLSFFALVVLALQTFFSSRIMVGVTIVGATTLSVFTYQQNRMWESPITLFSRIVQYNPRVGRVRHNLAMAYSAQGEEEKAIQEYEFILAHEKNPYPQTYHNLALIYLKRDNLLEGEKLLLKAIQTSPRFYPSYDYLIQIYEHRGEKEKVQEWRSKKQQNMVGP